MIALLRRILGFGVPRALKCSGCQVWDHCNGEDEDCYCECTANASPLP